MLREPSLWPEFDDVAVADVVVDCDAPDLQPTYTYAIPPHLNDLAVGQCVVAPFGGQERIGYVLRVRRMERTDPLAPVLKPLIARVDSALTFDSHQAAVMEWLVDHYVCDPLSALRCVMPAAMTFSLEKVITLAHDEVDPASAGRSISQAHLLLTLRRLGGSATADALERASGLGSFASACSALVRKGLVQEEYRVAQPRTVQRTEPAYVLGPVAAALPARLSPEARKVLDVLSDLTRAGKTPVRARQLLAETGVSSSVLRNLARQGAVVAQRVAVLRTPKIEPASGAPPAKLTDAQARALAEIEALASNRGTASGERVALLFGVTASGKTEVYLRAIGRTVAAGRSAVVLLPEIALTTQMLGVFIHRFGDLVAVLHSGLSEGERHDEWQRLQQGSARVAVGARSAVFAPLSDVGLFIVDEEHEPSYKQEAAPRYHAKDVARYRVSSMDAVVILGSATPSLETFYAAQQGNIACIRMDERVDSRPLPPVHIVDMREEWKRSRSLLSEPLLEALEQELARGRQAILFLNRRGYSQFLLCRECGFVIRCPNCAVSLTLHASEAALRCHHCDYRRSVPHVCPQCGGTRIRGFGLGTERVEEETARLVPHARIARMDRDTTSRRGAHAAILGAFRRGDVNVLIGTQMVAKGLDFPNVTLVGVVSADTSINMPDFRAAERTFQLTTQVAGRSGRGEEPGRVLIQTFDPDHYSLQMAASHDYEGFYRREIVFREELRYPPFTRLANLVCFDENAADAEGRALHLARALRQEAGNVAEIIGPAPAPLSRLKGSYRVHVIVRAKTDVPLERYIHHALERLPSSHRRRITIDIDPLSMA